MFVKIRYKLTQTLSDLIQCGSPLCLVWKKCYFALWRSLQFILFQFMSDIIFAASLSAAILWEVVKQGKIEAKESFTLFISWGRPWPAPRSKASSCGAEKVMSLFVLSYRPKVAPVVFAGLFICCWLGFW